MIQFRRESNGLARYGQQIPYIDTDQWSKNYFRLYDFPDRMYVGKNTFRIAGNSELLVPDSQIFIDILDVNNNPIYYEILDLIDADKSRVVVVYIYPDTPPGIATIYIGGRVSRIANTDVLIPWSNIASDSNFKHIPNLLWKGPVNVVLTKQNNTEVIFTSEPVIEYSEKTVHYDTVSTSSRMVEYYSANGDAVSILGRNIPYQLSGGTSKFVANTFTSTNMAENMPSVVDNAGTTIPGSVLPDYSEVSIIKSNNSIFSASMAGGVIYIRNINLQSEAPKDAIDPTVFSAIPDYSASIISVLNSTSVEVDRPFLHTVEYTTILNEIKTIAFTKLVDSTDFTASYFSTPTTVHTGSAFESFISVDISGIEPSVGTVDKVHVSYKPVGSYGEYIDVGQYEVKSKNLLVDDSVYTFYNDGLDVKHLGKLRSTSDINTYWTSSAINSTLLNITPTFRDSKIVNAVYLSPSGTFSEQIYATYKLNPEYYLRVYKDTEYAIEFNSFTEKYSGDWINPQIDVYISGSDIYSDHIGSKFQVKQFDAYGLGTYIGSAIYENGSMYTNTFPFIVKDTGAITPIFVVRSGKWDIGSVEIKPRQELGFAPNHVKLNIPLAQFKRRSELMIKFQYYNSDGVGANIDSKLYGVIFTGSSQIQFTELLNIPPGIVSSSDQVSGGQNKSIQFKYSGSLSGSGDFWYDPVNKLLMLGADASTYGEQLYPSQNVIRSTNPGLKAIVTYEKSGSTSLSEPIMSVMPEVYTGSGSLVNIGIGVGNPRSPIDAIIRGDHLYTARNLAAGSPSGSGIAYRQQSSSITSVGEVGKYYKLLNVSNDTVGTGTRLVVLGSVDAGGRTFMHIGLENSQLAGASSADSTWISIGSGSLNSQRFSGSGYDLYDIDWNKVVNKTTGLVSSSGQTNYNELSNKPIVGNIGLGRFLYNNNDPSHSIAATSIRFSTASSNLGKSTPVEQFNLMNGAQLVMITTSSVAGATHHVIHKQYVYEATGTLAGAISTNIAIPMSFTTYEGQTYTGSVNNAGIMYEVSSLFMATTGSNGTHGTYVWSNTVQGRVSVSGLNSGRPICYIPYIVSGGQGTANAYGYGPPTGSNYDSVHTVQFVTSSGLMYIQNTFLMTTPFGTSWDLRGAIKVNQTIYEVDNPVL